MLNIPYSFSGEVKLEKYSDTVKRIKKFPNHHVIGKDQSGTFDMYMIELGSSGKPVIMIMASMHGTEWHGTQYSMEFMENLRDNAFPDRELRDNILSNFHIIYIPVVNPWGYDRTTQYEPKSRNQGRYTSTGKDLNGDFDSFIEAESKNVKVVMDKYEPFAFLDLHMQTFDMAGNENENFIIGNGQGATNDIRNLWADSLESYIGAKVVRWAGYTNLKKGLARRYMRDKSNPYTPNTLSYIVEMTRIEERNGQIIAPLTHREIFKYGMANLYLFFKTSIEYFLRFNEIEDDNTIPDDLQTRPMGPSIIIKDKNLNNEVILQNAYNISYEKEANATWYASFSLPLNDPKLEKVQSLKWIEINNEDEYVGLFRLMPKLTRKNSEANYVTFECEHVLSTLLDSSLFKYHQLSNFDTKYVLKYLLDQQNHKHWKLGTVEFTRYFHYSWENENILTALFSVPKAFDEPYVFTFDTQSYPWTLNLVRPSTEVVSRIKEGYNLQTIEIEENPMSQFNRIYPLGAGEGVNQLTIESVNNGVPYLEDRAPGEEIREIIWVDQRYTHAESLKADAQAMLDKRKIPKMTWVASAADVSSITGLSIDKLKQGNVVRMDVDGFPKVDLRIMKEKRPDITGDPGNVDLEIGNVVEDLGATNADLERRQQINELYSQGATNIMNFTYQDNCDANTPATIPFYIDDDVVNINTIELTFRTKKFRAYSQATHGGGAIVKSTKGGGGIVKSTKGGGGTTRSTTSGGSTTVTSKSGGGTTRSTTSGGSSTQTSSSGGGTSKSTNSGGGSSQTSAAGGDHRHLIFSEAGAGAPPPLKTFADANGSIVGMYSSASNLHTRGSSGNHSHSVSIPNHSHEFSTPNHTHSVSIPSHTHDVSIPAHSHDVSIPSHSHNVTIPNHTHEIDLPNHTHEIELPDHTHDVKHEIIELNTTPSSVVIKVDGNTVPHTSTSGDRINLAEYMSKDSSGKINRGRHEVTIHPNGLARIEADLICRVFIQSQLGGKF